MNFKNKLIASRFIQEMKVRIPVEKGDLGLSIDAPLKDYKKQILNGKSWDELSQQLNALVVFNKNKHPEISKKWESKREALSKWVEGKRNKNPDFAK